jgi:hypothetical protein
MTKLFFGVLMLASSFTAMAQVAPTKTTQVYHLSTVNGKVSVDTGAGTVPAASLPCNGQLASIHANDKAYTLGDIFLLKLQPFCNIPSTGPGPVSVYISYTYTPWGGGTTITYPQFPCDCGGSNAGFLPTGLSAFQPVTLYSRIIGPDMTPGLYTYTAYLYDTVTGAYQSTSTAIWVLATSTGQGAFWISNVQFPTATGITINGKFSTSTGYCWFAGVPEFEGAFTTDCSLYSLDGKTLVIPIQLSTPGEVFAGSIVLMSAGESNWSTIARNSFPF